MSLRQGSDKLPFIKMVICFYHFFFFLTQHIFGQMSNRLSTYVLIFFDAIF